MSSGFSLGIVAQLLIGCFLSIGRLSELMLAGNLRFQSRLSGRGANRRSYVSNYLALFVLINVSVPCPSSGEGFLS